MENAYDVRETARLLGIKVNTVRAWIYRGKIHANKLAGSQKWIVTESEIKRLRGEQ